MNATRYRAYRRVRDLLASGEAAALDAEERHLLSDLAEEMLLTRSADPGDLEEVSSGARTALGMLTTRGALSRPAASDLWEGILAAGPEPASKAAVKPPLLPLR